MGDLVFYSIGRVLKFFRESMTCDEIRVNLQVLSCLNRRDSNAGGEGAKRLVVYNEVPRSEIDLLGDFHLFLLWLSSLIIMCVFYANIKDKLDIWFSNCLLKYKK